MGITREFVRFIPKSPLGKGGGEPWNVCVLSSRRDLEKYGNSHSRNLTPRGFLPHGALRGDYAVGKLEK